MRRWATAVAGLTLATLVAVLPTTAAADEPGYTTRLAPPPSRVGALSADGAIGATDSENRVVVTDRRRGTTTRITAGDGATSVDAMSADGRWLVLASTDSTLPPNRHGDPVRHLYRHDRRTDTTTLLTVRPDGSPALDASFASGISDDGRIVAFSSRDTSLAAPLPGPGQPVFVSAYARDVVTGVTAKAPAGNESGTGAITPDGRYVLYIDGVIAASVHTSYRL